MFNAQHQVVVGSPNGGPFAQAPRFWSNGEAVLAGYDGSVFELRVRRP